MIYIRNRKSKANGCLKYGVMLVAQQELESREVTQYGWWGWKPYARRYHWGWGHHFEPKVHSYYSTQWGWKRYSYYKPKVHWAMAGMVGGVATANQQTKKEIVNSPIDYIRKNLNKIHKVEIVDITTGERVVFKTHPWTTVATIKLWGKKEEMLKWLERYIKEKNPQTIFIRGYGFIASLTRTANGYEVKTTYRFI